MKKQVLFSLLFCAGVLFTTAQTQRMVLYEGFSNASCGPCAAANPAVNALLFTNPTKVVPIKYQVNWPGTDPMNAQTQTWAGPRVTYYTITGVPATRVDGTGTSFSQTAINTRYAVPSPFLMEVNHTFNAAQDSAFVEVRIEAAQNYTGSALVLQTAMVEKHISFATPPGSNGEKDFYNVMRRMYPNASGTTLPTTWTLGQVETYTFAVPVPTYIYQFGEIAFVAFIQSNSDKSVLQATKTIPDQYITIMSHNIPQEPGCYTQFAFQLSLVNQGKTPITSFDIEYGEVGQTPQIYNWTGSLDYGQTANVTLPALSVSGSPMVFAEVKNPNGGTNASSNNTYVEGQVMTVDNYNPVPVFQGFTSTTFPPTGWAVVSADNLKWERNSAGGFAGSPGGSARIQFYSSPQGAVDMLYMEPLDLTNSGQLYLTFSLAHARYSASYSDNLKVEISTNCGASWITLYNKSGADLATVTNFVTSSFIPTTAAQWRKESIDLSGYSSQNEILIRFNATSGYGNNLYIDDINIADHTSIEENMTNELISIYPNPVNDILNVEYKLDRSSDVLVNVFDVTGKNIRSVNSGNMSAGNHTMQIDASGWDSGLYHVVINTAGGTSSYKVFKN